MNVGRAARTMRSLTFSPELIEYPKSPWSTPFVAPLMSSGRKFGQPVGPRNAAGVGSEPRKVPSVSGLQNPIHRQYWIGIGWSRPQACLNFSRCSSVILGLFANFAVGPPGAASRIPYTTMVIPNRTGIAWSARRITNLAIGEGLCPGIGGWVGLRIPSRRGCGRGEGTPGGSCRAGPPARGASGVADGGPGSRTPRQSLVVQQAADRLLPDEPVLAVPGRAHLR